MFFANDSLVFFKEDRGNCNSIKDCLTLYEKASGQQINFDKSVITFSKLIPQNNILYIKDKLQLSVYQGHELYLGLSTFSIRRKRIQVGYLHDRVAKKLDGWKNRFFSEGGMEVLIKAVIQAIPTYGMTCFRIPSLINNTIESICAKFWWEATGKDKKIHWKAWSSLKAPKSEGGLGFRDLTNFNKALLAKQVWRIIEFRNSLVARVLKARYFKYMDIMEAPLSSNPSYI